MMLKRYFLSIISILLLGGFFEPKPLSIEELGRWSMTPIVKVCDTSPATVEQVKEAIDWWRERGYEFQGPITGPCLLGDNNFGLITVDLRGQGYSFSENSGARTYLSQYGEYIYHADIQLRRKPLAKNIVLKHEFGHALGLGHSKGSFSEQRGNIMNKNLKYAGENDRLVKKSDREANR